MQVVRIAVACLVILLLTAERLHAQDALASARELYASAEYDEALKMLDRLSAGAPSNNERQSIELYRTLCLFAIGRRDEADRTIEGMIARDPLYRPDDEISPRTRTAFMEARKRILPGIVQQKYAEAKGAFEQKNFEAAAAGFKRVIDALNDPDMGQAAQQPPLADLRTLAAGFHDLSLKAIPPPPPPPLPAPVAMVQPAPAVNLPPRIYTGEERGVRPPQTIAQELPKYPGAVPPRGVTGVVEVVINEVGNVESAAMVVSVANSYDKMVMTAASKWLYAPATMNGTPVKFRKRIQINIAPPTP
jgi:hypothetical protein